MIAITSPTTRDDFKAYYALRYRVLREPLGLPHGTEKDDYEPLSTHFMAVDEKTGKIVGVIKMYEKSAEVAVFSHLAVDENYQNQGIGRMLIEKVEEHARKQGYHALQTLTRLTATSYYEKRGYEPRGLAGTIVGKLQMMQMEKILD